MSFLPVFLAREQPDLSSQLVAAVETLEPETQLDVVRAFTTYFHVINIAEERQRLYQLRLREMREGRRPESLADTLQQLAARGVPGEHLRDVLTNLQVQP